MLQTSLLLMKSLSKTETPIFLSVVCSLFPKAIFFYVYCPSFRPMDMVGEACLPSNGYYPRTPDYTLYSGVHVC